MQDFQKIRNFKKRGAEEIRVHQGHQNAERQVKENK